MTKKTIVFAPGAWDLFHVGHLALLNAAKNIASVLYVGVDTDDSIKEKKGVLPIIPFLDRTAVLRACTHVDHIIINHSGAISLELLQQFKIEVVVLGSDWKNKDLKGKKEAKAAGVNFVYFPYTRGISSTQIQVKIIKTFTCPDCPPMKTQWDKD